jgi:hypothetical protein
VELNTLLESLETEFDAIETTPSASLRNIGMVTVELGDRIATLENLVFARDFVMGVNQGRVIAVPHSKLKIRSFTPGKAALSKRTFSSWLKSITGLWIGVTANGQTKQSRLLGAQRGLVILRESIIAIETVDSIAIGAVDNSLTD